MLPVTLLTSPLHDRHVALGAKLADFSGWSMPIEYAGGGVLAEHAAVRGAVGLFDVSHLGTGTVRGPGAAKFVNRCLTNDLGRIRPGQAQYTLCCDRNGGVVDDLIVYLHGPDDVLLVPNAANAADVLARLAAAAELIVAHGPVAAAGVGLPRAVRRGQRAVGVPDVGRRRGGGRRAAAVRPPHGRAGELGHQVIEVGGPPCGCGNRCCVEAFAAGAALYACSPRTPSSSYLA